MTEAALALSEQKLHDIGELLSLANQEQARLVADHAKEKQQLKKVHCCWGELGRLRPRVTDQWSNGSLHEDWKKTFDRFGPFVWEKSSEMTE